ncbi:hypothetical protein THAOC_25450 [Thalassiosira oceanica]|uniref:Uncharacterized protein n=1 Tax=Thalassiosira oceanica TaxID=159749 RepID=K0RMC4_THAOC|nr:hypothetical protein THAOC_25450 [Thalassiosira oceanica]|eukprot:EJK54883.1 hypothetical protein THAOC_25450 [Thalassiosira oceanica]
MVRIGIGRSGTNRRSNGEAVPRIILRNASNCGLLAIPFFAALTFAIIFHVGVFVADIIPSRHASDDSDVDVLTDDLISWVKSNGAFIDDRISIRRVDPADPTSPRGIFADRGSFEKGEKLFSIPTELIYDGKPRTVKQNVGKRWKDDHHDCGTTYEIHDAMLSGATPYGRYLAAQPRRYVPGYFRRLHKLDDFSFKALCC